MDSSERRSMVVIPDPGVGSQVLEDIGKRAGVGSADYARVATGAVLPDGSQAAGEVWHIIVSLVAAVPYSDVERRVRAAPGVVDVQRDYSRD